MILNTTFLLSGLTHIALKSSQITSGPIEFNFATPSAKACKFPHNLHYVLTTLEEITDSNI